MIGNMKGSFALSTAACIAFSAHAQTAPDAGRTLQQTPRTLDLPTEKPGIRIDIPSSVRSVAPGGPTVAIQTIRFEGNTALTEAQLLSALGDRPFKAPLDLSQIQDLADQLTQFYQASGYPFAKVFVPAQTMSQGALRLQVVEGRFGSVVVTGEPTLAAAVSNMLGTLKTGQVIEAAPLERATLLVSDLPGVQVEPLMRPGKDTGAGDLFVNALSTRGFSGDVGFDNFGGRFTGQNRIRLNGQYDSPFMVGDQIQVRTIATDESLYLGSLAYSLPLGNNGLRGLVSASHTQYELGKQFAALKANGTADIFSLGVTYPLVRSQQTNVNLSGQWQYKRLNDKQDVVGLNNNKNSQSLPLTLGFDTRDTWLGVAGLTYGALTYTFGELNLDQGLTTIDQTNAKTAGSYQKLNADVARIQPLGNAWSLYVRGSAQSANKNLDSSEGFSLGGASGVRAYPTGEAFGDEGYFAQMELRYASGSVSPYAFYDAGQITIRHKPFTADSNKRHIAGAGAGVRYTQGPWSADGFIAWRVDGGKPQSDTLDRNPRVWITTTYRF